jgi:hypothetical protein
MKGKASQFQSSVVHGSKGEPHPDNVQIVIFLISHFTEHVRDFIVRPEVKRYEIVRDPTLFRQIFCYGRGKPGYGISPPVSAKALPHEDQFRIAIRCTMSKPHDRSQLPHPGFSASTGNNFPPLAVSQAQEVAALSVGRTKGGVRASIVH